MNKLVLIFIIINASLGLFSSLACSAETPLQPVDPIYHFGYNDREHSYSENFKNISIVYGMTWFFYPLVQPKVFHGAGGIKNYQKNFGKLVFDQDEPFWNEFIHPITGAQLYLLYRADGYDRLRALEMTLISSSLFEFTVEIFTEPASVQDLYQTPILGTVLGYGLENISMFLLNSDTTMGLIIGHLINPATLLPMYEGRSYLIPLLDEKDKGAMIKMEFNF